MLCVSGSRNATNEHADFIFSHIDSYITFLRSYESHIHTINVGDCRGVDTIVKNHYMLPNYYVNTFRAEWGTYGRSAGPRRNRRMIEQSDFLIAFPDISSKGTRNAIKIAKEKGMSYLVVDLNI